MLYFCITLQQFWLFCNISQFKIAIIDNSESRTEHFVSVFHGKISNTCGSATLKVSFNRFNRQRYTKVNKFPAIFLNFCSVSRKNRRRTMEAVTTSLPVSNVYRLQISLCSVQMKLKFTLKSAIIISPNIRVSYFYQTSFQSLHKS